MPEIHDPSGAAPLRALEAAVRRLHPDQLVIAEARSAWPTWFALPTRSRFYTWCPASRL
jgi:hypothetical protein